MAATFNPGLLTPLDRVRQLIGDTDVNAPKFDDATITFYLQKPLSEFRAASALAYDLAAKYAGMADVTVDDQLTRASHLFDHYSKLAARLLAQDQETPNPSAGSAYGGGVIVTGLGDCRGPLDDCCF
jgi:hypothetical protein